jgi:predicted nuclease of predicted toxin-antitoxin system
VRFLTDQDIYQITLEWLKSEGHDVATARELNLHRASDKDLLNKAVAEDRRVVTRDKDFGALVFLRKKLSPGVIILQTTPNTIADVHVEFKRLVREHDEEELRRSFCVVEAHRYRIRHIFPSNHTVK